jgi:thiamine transport system substrate-binding protein
MKRTLTFFVGTALVLAACTSTAKSSTTPTTAKGSSGVKPPSKTVVLLTHDSFAATPAVLADFTKQTGFKVKLVQPGDAGVVVNQAILTKSHPLGDVLYGVDNTFLSRALDANLFDPYVAKGLDAIPADVQLDPQHRVTPIDVGTVCVDYDNTWFGHGNHPPAPTGLDSLVDPRYKNLLVAENAGTSSPGLAFLLSTIDAHGDPGWQDYWRALQKNGVRIDDSWTTAYDTDFTAGGGGGDRPIVVSYATDPAADVVFSKPHRDTPHVSVIPSTCFRQVEFAGVLHGAKNPQGAQALVDFLLSRTFQEDMPLQMYVRPVNPAATLPAVFTQWSANPSHASTMDPQTIGAHRDAWIKQWNGLVGG